MLLIKFLQTLPTKNEYNHRLIKHSDVMSAKERKQDDITIILHALNTRVRMHN